MGFLLDRRTRQPNSGKPSAGRVIGEAHAPYNARSCRGAGAGYSAVWRRSPIDSAEPNMGIAGAIVRSGTMLRAVELAPHLSVDGRKHRITVRPVVHLGDDEPVGERHRLGVDLAAAGHHDGVGAPAQRIAA